MSYQPILPTGGYTGWKFLQRTLPQQQEAFKKSAPVQRSTDYFRANIAKARTAADLVNDRRLLEVALGAFGLKDDLNAKAFIQRVLEGGTARADALANRLADKRYKAFAQEFGYGDLGARTGLSGFADKIIARYEARAFQEAVGQADGTMRLALNVDGAIKDIAARTTNVNAQWFSMMGEAPLRQVFQTALGLPASVAALDVDRQLATYKERALATFGADKLADFADPARQEKLVRLFLLRSETQATSSSPAALALQLLPRR